MQCRITTLAENTSGKPNIIGEWGFCALVETEEMSAREQVEEQNKAQ